MSNAIAIVRKAGPSKPEKKVTVLRNLRKRIGIISRVARPAILDFFLGEEGSKANPGFWKLSAATQAAVKNPALLLLDEIDFWIVPESDLGRKGEATASQAESIRLWISKHLVESGIVTAEEVAVVFLPDYEG